MEQHEAPFYTVDSFTHTPFKGNPAALCLMPCSHPDSLYLDISREVNTPETAFMEQQAPGTYRLRWFTPLREVPLCGHGTLAAAHILFNELHHEGEHVKFNTAAGTLHAWNTPDGVKMDFPMNKPTPAEPQRQVLDALGIEQFHEFLYSDTNQKLVIRLDTAQDVEAVHPDPRRLLEADNPLGWRAVVVTAPGSEPYDFVSRSFAPFMGIDEDPVTGSNHTVLGPYWGEVLGKRRMRAYQASSRGGSLTVENVGTRVHLTGRAVTVITGRIRYRA